MPFKYGFLGGHQLRGGACANSQDPITFEELSDIDPPSILQVPHESDASKTWCFDVNALFAYWQSTPSWDKRNPLTNLQWTDAQKIKIVDQFLQRNLLSQNNEDLYFMGGIVVRTNDSMMQLNKKLRALKFMVRENLQNALPALIQDTHFLWSQNYTDERGHPQPVQGHAILQQAIRLRLQFNPIMNYAQRANFVEGQIEPVLSNALRQYLGAIFGPTNVFSREQSEIITKTNPEYSGMKLQLPAQVFAELFQKQTIEWIITSGEGHPNLDELQYHWPTITNQDTH